MRVIQLQLALALAIACLPPRTPFGAKPPPILWSLDNLDAIGGHPITIVGNPRLAETAVGRAVEFDGAGDGLFAIPFSATARQGSRSSIAPRHIRPADSTWPR